MSFAFLAKSQILLESLEPFLVGDSINPNLLEIFSSFSDQARVEALRNSIEGLLEMENESQGSVVSESFKGFF